jgi:wobble nucleotide-excising tRNase
MLKRITKLKNIGRFKDCISAKTQFEKITLIYGRNTYGKTTITEVLASLSNQDTQVLSDRKSIPDDGTEQQAELNFLTAAGKEVPVRLTNAGWSSNLPDDLKLIIFDDNFYHSNLFEARSFTRSTKEKFSAFILGVQGVQKAQTIADKKREKREVTSQRVQLKQAAFTQIKDIEEFVSLKVPITIAEVKKNLATSEIELEKINLRLRDSIKIKGRELLTPNVWTNSVSNGLGEMNDTLSSSLDGSHDQAKQKVQTHIENHFTDFTNAENWLKQGLHQNNHVNCQFCGQGLIEDSKQLLNLYRDFFNEAYEKEENKIRASIERNWLLISEDLTNPVRINIEKNNSTFNSYPEMVESKEYLDLKSQLNQIAVEINQAISNWDEVLRQTREETSNAIKKKLTKIHSKITAINTKNLTSVEAEINNILIKYNELIRKINEKFQAFKDSTNPIIITKEIQISKTAIENSVYELRRLELAEQCDIYIALSSRISQLEDEIPQLLDDLKNDQSKYLTSFFTRLNTYFKIFGSIDFTLEVGQDNSGHTPIYFLKVKFKGATVAEKRLASIFSESDRRALALSVYWANLSGLDEKTKENSIIVLDDPMTSFDSSRMTAVHREFIGISSQAKQVIMLSHFDTGLCNLLQTYNRHGIKLLSIEQNKIGSTLSECDIDEFIKTEHERERDKVLNFINGITNDISFSDLRVFLEIELNLRFAKQIKDCSINETDLSKRIEALEANTVITVNLANDLNDWRVNLNPSHHIWLKGDLEDKRNTALQFMNFVYNNIVPA